MSSESARPFDLEERTLAYAMAIRRFIRKLPRHIANYEDSRQVVRSSGSIGANYIEANESLGPNDFKHKLRIAKKESKETIYWLKLLDTGNNESLELERQQAIQEATELMRILASILRKATHNP